MIRRAIAVGLFFFLATPTQAASTVYGNGGASCALFLVAAQAKQSGNPSVDSFMMWFSGYASLASAQTGIDYFDDTTPASRQHWLEEYCKAHHLGMFDEAVAALMAVLAEHQGQ